MNVASLIYDCLNDNLTIEGVVFKLDEFDSKDPSLQVLIETFPERSTWVARGVYRVEQRVRITIYLKLIRYEPSNVAEYRTTWFTLKQEINDILAKNKFNISGVSNLDLIGGWDDKGSIAVGRGAKTTIEPIIWRSEQELNTIYYNKQTLEVE